MYARFAWRYFRSKKSTGAIQLISRLSLFVIAFATCCQLLVLSVYNGFEEIVYSLYATFYTDLKIVPAEGKFIEADTVLFHDILQQPGVQAATAFIEEKALLKHGDVQTVVRVKGVNADYAAVCAVPAALKKGTFDLGDAENPGLVMGAGVQYAAGVSVEGALSDEPLVLILPNAKATGSDISQSLSEGVVTPKGTFVIQQDFDNYYAFTNTAFLQQQMGLAPEQVSGIEIKLKPGAAPDNIRKSLADKLGKKMVVQTREEQNLSLYRTMKTEKWVIFAILTFILIIAAFNIISALSMLVIEKQKDIHILQSLGASSSLIRKIFISQGALLGMLGTASGVLLALLLCTIQQYGKFLKIRGGSFLIDYFPVRISVFDVLIVTFSALCIVLLAAWIPAQKSTKTRLDLR